MLVQDEITFIGGGLHFRLHYRVYNLLSVLPAMLMSFFFLFLVYIPRCAILVLSGSELIPTLIAGMRSWIKLLVGFRFSAIYKRIQSLLRNNPNWTSSSTIHTHSLLQSATLLRARVKRVNSQLPSRRLLLLTSLSLTYSPY